MNHHIRPETAGLAAICLFFCLGAFGNPPNQTQASPPIQKANPMTAHAKGTFEVKLTPQKPDEGVDPTIGRMSLDKKFSGDLEATSRGQMLAISTAEKGSAGYVAMEQVTGTLQGRQGTFALQHSGTMTRGEGKLVIEVVPDSGTGQLVGLTGQLTIQIVEGKHLYEFSFTLPATAGN